jgi:hypothetical protein
LKATARSKSRFSKPLSNKAKLIGGTAGALLVWQVVVVSLAAGHGDGDGDIAAADYASTSPAAATAAAEQRLTDGDPAGAKVFAVHALARAPISAAALRSLGLAEQGLGHWQNASALMSQSAGLGWRDAPTQLWLAQAFLQQKDYPRAAERVDAALRTNPRSTDLFKLLDQLIVDPRFAQAIMERLKLNPNWRPNYLAYTDNVPQAALQARATIISGLSRSEAPPTRNEIRPLVFALIGAGQAAQARALWLSTLHLQASAVYDQSFEHSGTSGTMPFEWTQLPVLGASLSIEPAPHGPGMMMRAQTDGSASGVLLRQWTVLPPGPHMLRYSGSIPANARNAFGWSVRCVPSGKIVFSSVGSASPPLYRFDIPVDCSTQLVELHVASSAAAANSEAHFTRFDIE